MLSYTLQFQGHALTHHLLETACKFRKFAGAYDVSHAKTAAAQQVCVRHLFFRVPLTFISELFGENLIFIISSLPH